MQYLNKFRLDGRVALVTGAFGILGKEVCRGLVEAGANVALVDLEQAVDESFLQELGGSAEFFCCDVADERSVSQCVRKIVDRFDRIDILHNNAATKTSNPRDFFAPFESYPIETWREVMSVNIDGMFLVAQAVGKIMRDQGAGVIVQTSSIYGMLGPDKRIYFGSNYLGGEINTPAVYSASKAAVIGLTKWLATYWGGNGIRVNCLVPGGMSSGQNSQFSELYSSKVPMARMARVEEMVPPFLYLVSDASSYVTGHVMAVDGGWSAW